jgi:hypothetical protein
VEDVFHTITQQEMDMARNRTSWCKTVLFGRLRWRNCPRYKIWVYGLGRILFSSFFRNVDFYHCSPQKEKMVQDYIIYWVLTLKFNLNLVWIIRQEFSIYTIGPISPMYSLTMITQLINYQLLLSCWKRDAF